MDAVTRLLKKIQQIPVEQPKPEPTWKRLRAEHLARVRMDGMWEADKAHNRDLAFEKAKLVRAQNLEIRRAEKEAEELRQKEIEKTRLKNLRKARRVLAKMKGE